MENAPTQRPPHSVVPDDLIDAYRATHYRVGVGSDAFTLRIDERSPRLARLFDESAHRSAAFITACNPRSNRQRDELNAAAHARLCAELARQGFAFIEGAGVDPAGPWQEQSVLALGIALDAARKIGLAFDQNAIVWAGEDAIPRLCLLR